MNTMAYGQILKKRLTEKGISAAQLAKETNIPAQTIYSIINKDIEHINKDYYQKIENVLHDKPSINEIYDNAFEIILTQWATCRGFKTTWVTDGNNSNFISVSITERFAKIFDSYDYSQIRQVIYKQLDEMCSVLTLRKTLQNSGIKE